MNNGSLDQHLFPKGRSATSNQRERPTGATIWQWATRYGIVRDIATGLHYVHHEYEPMVLHRDIKASNVMLDTSFGARLGDFGLACTVDVDRNSATGVGGTWGYIAPEYAMSGKATRQTDIYALGVLILEVVTGKHALIHGAVDDDDVHITDRVWRLHRQQRLPECLDAVVLPSSSENDEERQLEAAGDAERLLLLGLACSSPNPSERPTMPEVVQVIAKSAPPPSVPAMKPRFVWPPEGVAWSGDDSEGTPMTSVSDLYMSRTTAVSEPHAAGRHASLQLEQFVYVTASSALV
jgi:interleukin-1 receptor-associated kinase 1